MRYSLRRLLVHSEKTFHALDIRSPDEELWHHGRLYVSFVWLRARTSSEARSTATDATSRAPFSVRHPLRFVSAMRHECGGDSGGGGACI